MFAVAAILAAFVACVVGYAPQPASLRESGRPSLKKRLTTRKGTLALGIGLVTVSYLTFEGGELSVSTLAFLISGARGRPFLDGLRIILTAPFLHFDYPHLLTNLIALAVLMAYEEKTGSFRFVALFFAAGWAVSAIEWFLLPKDTIAVGASAGLLALAAAWICDEAGSFRKNRIAAVAALLLLFAATSFETSKGSSAYGIDWRGHLLGVAAGAVIGALWRRTDGTGAITAQG